MMKPSNLFLQRNMAILLLLLTILIHKTKQLLNYQRKKTITGVLGISSTILWRLIKMINIIVLIALILYY